MGNITVCCFKPKMGKEEEFKKVVADHLPVLRSLGLATDWKEVALKASDGSVIEVFEWVSEDAIRSAHTNPDVQKLWQRYSDCSDLVKLSDLPESKEPFPGFEPLF